MICTPGVCVYVRMYVYLMNIDISLQMHVPQIIDRSQKYNKLFNYTYRHAPTKYIYVSLCVDYTKMY